MTEELLLGRRQQEAFRPRGEEERVIPQWVPQRKESARAAVEHEYHEGASKLPERRLTAVQVRAQDEFGIGRGGRR